MKRTVPAVLACIGSIILVAACTAGPGAVTPSAPASSNPPMASSNPPTASSASPDDRPLPSGSTGELEVPSAAASVAPGSVPPSIIVAAIAHAAKVTGLDPASISVISAEAKTWNDGSLGCPKPGEMYTQALVPGYRIKLDAGGQTLDYHASESGTLVLCESPGGGVGAAPGETSDS